MAQSLELGLDTFGDVTVGARDEFFPHFKAQRDRIGAERGWRGSMSRTDFDREVEHGYTAAA